MIARVAVVVPGLALAAAASLGAAATPPLRPAEAVLADYAKAIGGQRAWKRHHSLHVKHEIEVAKMQMRGTAERYATSDDKVLTVTEVAKMGRFREGTDGHVFWSEDPINGLRVLDGAEAEEQRIDSAWDGEIDMARQYQKVRSVPPPVDAPAGQRYECVELIAKVAAPAITCFDAATHLRVLQKGTHASPQGPQPYLTHFGDWRDVKGMKLAYSEEMVAGPMTLVSHLVKIDVDQPIDAKLFDLPAAVKQQAAATGH